MTPPTNTPLALAEVDILTTETSDLRKQSALDVRAPISVEKSPALAAVAVEIQEHIDGRLIIAHVSLSGRKRLLGVVDFPRIQEL